MKSSRYAIVLAGGKGTRLWPLSRENYPKQFIQFRGGQSLFQLTIQRLRAAFPLDRIIIVSQDNYRFTLANQIDFLHLTRRQKTILKQNTIFEPAGRNTLPAVLLATAFLKEKHGLCAGDVISIFPSDHVIEPVRQFVKGLKNAARLAHAGKIVVFGVKPTSPKAGFGYVVPGKRCAPGWCVKRFVEKPLQSRARALIRQGALWNAGIFTVCSQTFFREIARYQPRIARFAHATYAQLVKKFNSIPAVSIDYGIMQKTSCAALVEFNLTWSDLGSWDSYVQFQPSRNGNVSRGAAEFLNAKNCFAFSPNRLICMVGVNDLIAVDSGDSVLVVRKGETDKVRGLVSLIEKKGLAHSKDSTTVYRPWGYYTVLHQGPQYKVKEIGIYPQRSLSLQRHALRSEHWNVVEGNVRVRVQDRELQAGENESIFVPRKTKHRIFNPGSKIAKIIEVQIGSYLGEDDIVRYTAYR